VHGTATEQDAPEAAAKTVFDSARCSFEIERNARGALLELTGFDVDGLRLADR